MISFDETESERILRQSVRDFARELPADAYLEIRYEDLCAAPEPAVRKLCDFIGEPFDKRMLSPHDAESTVPGLIRPRGGRNTVSRG